MKAMLSQSTNPITINWYNSMTVEELKKYAEIIRNDLKNPKKWFNAKEAADKLQTIEAIVIEKTTGNLWQ